SEHIELLEIASNGDALVGGYYEQGDLGTGELPSGGSRNALLMRIATDGSVKWAFGLASAGWDMITGLAFDEPTNTLVASVIFAGAATLSTGQSLGFGGGAQDSAVLGINAETGALRWSRILAGSDTQGLVGMARTSDGLVVAGSVGSSTSFDG